LERIQQTLLEGKLAHTLSSQLSPDEKKLIKSYNFLTLKPFIYALNIAPEDIANAEALQQEFMQKLQAPVAVVCVKLEAEMMEMTTPEKLEFLAEMFTLEQSTIPTLDDLIALAFQTLELMYYFTTGEKETKARTIPLHSTAPQAA
jgi:ribosome-binding ATPase YchF (GTP1/OBG family)